MRRDQKRLEIWVNSLEYERIRELAKRKGLTLSSLARSVLLEAAEAADARRAAVPPNPDPLPEGEGDANGREPHQDL